MFTASNQRLAAIGISLALLGACATPQKQCIARETAEYRAVSAQIKKLEETSARGYALHRQTIPYTDTRICRVKGKEPFLCPRTRFRTIETPVSVDMGDVRKKLERLKAQRVKLSPSAAAARDACIRAYPE
ncbi:hypothetical protein SAMN04488030_0599 [Aliiroseovarius halocynthiae]|uniref:Uncharacterized protein n=1 Tax=Aliiroseovarius halocynthiae TaxID=985055 RepID=A0A545SUD1_9RHOB|nr:hypothetical protein [Aliiroseovarius halocynthiae]TQV68573.1 hypothetical protein FIL88_03020 [Aliiroseovarius halocynthiae]SMR70979.1 hypothetical protein SAMN04488030_0599 [Aliiroseovarius halocynthiae]